MAKRLLGSIAFYVNDFRLCVSLGESTVLEQDGIRYRDLDESTEKGCEYLAAVHEEAIEEIILEPLENYVDKFNAAVERLLKVVPTEDSLKSTYH